jgi:hypothetical protein
LRPSQPASRPVTIGQNAPLASRRDAAIMHAILKNGSRIFLSRGLDSRVSLEMPRKFRFFAQAFFDPGGGALSPLHEKLPSQGESVAHRLHPRRHGRACPACGAEAPSARRRPGHPRL